MTNTTLTTTTKHWDDATATDSIDACHPVLALDYNVSMIAIQSFTVWLQNNTERHKLVTGCDSATQ